MFCPKCGELLPERTRKCPVCGARIKKQTGRVNSASNFTPFDSSKFKTYDRTHTDCNHDHCTQVNFTCKHTGAADSLGIVEICTLFFKRYGDFSGRTGRREYWLSMLMLFVGSLFFGSFGLGGAWVLLTLIPWAAATVRRFRDAGIPAAVLIAALVPLVGWLLVLILCTRPSSPDNQWGTKA